VRRLFIALCIFLGAAISSYAQCEGIDVKSVSDASWGNPITFEAYRSGGFVGTFSFDWTIIGGEVSSGAKGSAIITVVPDVKDEKFTLTARLTATHKGDGCQVKASKSVQVNPRPRIADPDRFGALGRWEMQAVIDNLFIALGNDPSRHGLIVFESGPSETRREKLYRLKLITTAVTYRKYDSKRLSILIRKNGNETQYTPYLIERGQIHDDDGDSLFLLSDLIKNISLAVPKDK
jgi:hypothetical protein